MFSHLRLLTVTLCISVPLLPVIEAKGLTKKKKMSSLDVLMESINNGLTTSLCKETKLKFLAS